MRGQDTDARTGIPEIPSVTDLTPIGRGGSGVIYRGRQEALSRDVAVKVLAAPPATSASVERWERELDAMGRLSNHPNIVAVYDSGLTEDGRPYLVMPYVPGGTLGDRVRVSGVLNAEEAVTIGVKIANALTAAHAAGVLHRDVKPDNVLLSPYEPQLADFGIARLVDTTTTAATAAGLIHATINYAAPEVLAGEPASEASDVYGLAATLHTALSGEVPYPHAADANAIAVAHQIVHESVPRLGGNVPPRLAEVIAGAMAKDPSARPASAAEFSRLLTSAIEAGGETTRTVRASAIPTVVAPTVQAPRPQRLAARERRVDRAGRGGPSRTLVGVVAVIALAATLLVIARSSSGQRSGDTSPTPTTVANAPADRTATSARAAASPASAVSEAARRYFTRLSEGDYGGAYAMLSPGFRAAQSRESFEGFWRSASPVSISGPITGRSLTATVPLRMAGRANTYTLSFTRGSGDALFVDGPRPR